MDASSGSFLPAQSPACQVPQPPSMQSPPCSIYSQHPVHSHHPKFLPLPSHPCENPSLGITIHVEIVEGGTNLDRAM